jgi:hypothetical protein
MNSEENQNQDSRTQYRQKKQQQELMSPNNQVPPPDPWENDSEAASEPTSPAETTAETSNDDVKDDDVADLQRQKERLQAEIEDLQAKKKQLAQDQLQPTQANIDRMVELGLQELQERKQALEVSIEQLERRRERIQREMRTTFAGASQELAVRVQGFKDYLVGSLQDLAAAAEQLQLTPEESVESEPTTAEPTPSPEPSQSQASPSPFRSSDGRFQDEAREIRRCLDQYRKKPDYYGPPWQLRRTFEPVHAERVSQWFFAQGGRGAVRSMGSRLQNILIASAAISILRRLHGNRLQTMILAHTPERLGEWRRGLQDCLGISRADFGPDKGVTLFESPEALAQKADRIEQSGQLPLIVVDETENQVSLSILQFPLWIAFAPDPSAPTPTYW